MRKLIVALLVLTALGWVRSASAQPRFATSGTEFWISFPANEGGELPTETQNAITLELTSNATAHVTVEVTALGYFKTAVVQPHGATTINLPAGNDSLQTVEIDLAGVLYHDRAIHVVADSAITVFALTHKLYSSEAFLAYPVAAFGKTFRTACFPTSMAPASDPQPGEFLVLASEDQTTVTITPSCKTLDSRDSGVQFQKLLSRGDIYMVQSALTLNADLTGSLVTADKPITVLSGHKRTEMPLRYQNSSGTTSRNILLEQLLPVELWDSSAAVVPFAGEQLSSVARIISGSDGNRITITSWDNIQPHDTTLASGEFYEVPSMLESYLVSATGPIEVMEYLHSSLHNPGQSGTPHSDPAMVLSPSLRHMDTTIVVDALSDLTLFPDQFVSIIESEDDPALSLDGRTTSVDGTRLPIGTSGLTYATARLTPGIHTIHSSKPFAVMTFGMGVNDAYAYSGGLMGSAPTKGSSSVSSNIVEPALAPFPNPVDPNVSNEISVPVSTSEPAMHGTLWNAAGMLVGQELSSSLTHAGWVTFKLPPNLPLGVYAIQIQSSPTGSRARYFFSVQAR